MSKLAGRLRPVWGAGMALLCLGLGSCEHHAAAPSPVVGAPSGIDLTRVVCIRSHKQGQSHAYYDRYTGQPTPIASLALDIAGGTAEFAEGLVAAHRPSKTIHDSPAGYVDAAGRVVIPFQYEWAARFHEGRATVAVDGKFGLIDSRGSWVVPPGKYDVVGSVNDGRCTFRVGDKWGILDRDGVVMVPPRYRQLTSYGDGRCLAEYDESRYACLDLNGQVCFKLPRGAEAVGWERGGSTFEDGLVRIEFSPPLAEGLYGYVDTTGRVVVEPIYSQAGDFSEGLAPVSKNATTGFNDDPSSEYEWVPGKDDAWGFIDTNGRVVIPFKFVRVGRFSCGLARARQGDAWGYIDRAGNFVVPPTYEDVYDFRDGIARVILDNKYAFIDLTGRIVVRTNEEVSRF